MPTLPFLGTVLGTGWKAIRLVGSNLPSLTNPSPSDQEPRALIAAFATLCLVLLGTSCGFATGAIADMALHEPHPHTQQGG